MRVAGVVALAALGCAGGGGRGAGGADSAGAPEPSTAREVRVETLVVNRGTQGLRSTVRWVLSPDKRAIIVVEDAVSIEADPLPNGFLYASEATGAIVQLDSVWDVAPSPDWTRLAFSRAYVLNARELDTMPVQEWRRIEGKLPEDVAERDVATLRRRLESHAFPASGMTLMLGLGLTQVLWVDSLGSGRVTAPTGPTHSLHGWRVRWAPSGDTLAVGAAPRMVQDDAAPARWVFVRPRRWARYRDSLGVTTDSSRFAIVDWVAGPTIELATSFDLTTRRELAINGGTVESRDGTIRVTQRGPTGRPEVHVVGPGLALAATTSGRFIAALVARTGTNEQETRPYPVVYHVSTR